MSTRSRRALFCAMVLLLGSGFAVSTAPLGGAICGSVGGYHVSVSGCADPLAEMGYLDAPPPPPPPPPPDAPPPPPPPPPPPAYIPPPPLPNVDVCASVGRRISVGGCI